MGMTFDLDSSPSPNHPRCFSLILLDFIFCQLFILIVWVSMQHSELEEVVKVSFFPKMVYTFPKESSKVRVTLEIPSYVQQARKAHRAWCDSWKHYQLIHWLRCVSAMRRNFVENSPKEQPLRLVTPLLIQVPGLTSLSIKSFWNVSFSDNYDHSLFLSKIKR